MPTPKRPVAKKATPKTETTGKRTILLVEDDTFLAGMYVTKLELEGFRVVLASDGEQAIALSERESPNIMLLDIVLPKKSGFEVLQAVKANPATKDVPVILLTNLGQKEDVEKGLKLGALDYLIKAHFMPSEVVAKVKRLLK